MYVDKRSQPEAEDDPDEESKRTIFCANLNDRVTEEILYELFIQGGPVESVHIAKDKDGRQKTFGFVTYFHPCSVPYALELFEGVKLYNQRIVLKPKQSNNAVRSFISPSASKFHIGGDSRDRGDGRQFSNNSTLRLGSAHVLNQKNDPSLRPKDAETKNPLNPFMDNPFDSNPKANFAESNVIAHKNPFKVDVFARLGGDFLVNSDLKEKASNLPKDNGSISKHSFRNNRSNNRSNPYKRPEISTSGDRDRGRASRNRNSKKRRR